MISLRSLASITLISMLSALMMTLISKLLSDLRFDYFALLVPFFLISYRHYLLQVQLARSVDRVRQSVSDIRLDRAQELQRTVKCKIPHKDENIPMGDE